MTKNETLVVLAAGIGSRFGGVKQLKPVGPAGEIIMDYSVFDAVEAGFRKIVFLLRRDIAEDFHQSIGRRVEAFCACRGVEVAYAFQDRQDLPGGFACPEGRTKPWGTGQAVLACREVVDGPFVVLNADDYYGRSAFGRMLRWLRDLPEESRGSYCMTGFHLGNTLSAVGGVTRGVCQVTGEGFLQRITETRNVRLTPRGPEANGVALDPACWVSMNLWGFTPDLFEELEIHFLHFLEEHGRETAAEFILPEVVDVLLRQGRASVQVLPTEDSWMGMTYQEDVPPVTAAFRDLVDRGVYVPGLYGGETHENQ